MTIAIQHERALECAHEQVLQLEHDIDTANPSTMLAFAIHCDMQIDPQRRCCWKPWPACAIASSTRLT